MDRLLEITLSLDDNDVCEVGIHDAESGDWVHRSFLFMDIGNGYSEEYSNWINRFGEWIAEEIYSWFIIMKDVKGE